MKLWYLLLLLSFNVGAAEFMLKLDYVAPTERENCIEKNDAGDCIKYQPLAPEEIAGYRVWHVNCINPVYNDPDVPLLKNIRSYWFMSDKPEQCLSFVTVDTDGRLSVHSEMFIARDFRAPQAATCTF